MIVDAEIISEEEVDEKALDMRAAGKSEREVCSTFGISRARLRAAIDERVRDALTPTARLRVAYMQQRRCARLLPVFMEQAETGDCQSAMVVAKIFEQERIASGLGGPHAPDVVLSAEALAQPDAGFDKIRAALDQLRRSDPRRIRNGGPGYSIPGWPDSRAEEDRLFLEAQTDSERQRLAEEK